MIKKEKGKVKMFIVVFTIFLALSFLWFLIGFEVGSNKKLLDYQLYKYTNGITDPGEHLPSPKDRVSEDQIWVTKNRRVVFSCFGVFAFALNYHMILLDTRTFATDGPHLQH